MNEYGYGSLAGALLAEWGFSNVMFLTTVAETIGARNVSALSVRKYLAKTIGPCSHGSIPVFMGTPMHAAPPGYPGIHRGGIEILQWTGDKFVTTSPGFITAPALQ